MVVKNWNITLGQKRVNDVAVAACIGYFDGLHLGHQALISETVKLANELECETALITFNPDPWVTIKGIQDVYHLTTMKQREVLAERFGIQHFFVIDFTAEMASLSPNEFLELLSLQINLKGLVSGFDFHYGAKGLGNTDTLLQISHQRFEYRWVTSINDEQGKISSTRVSDAVTNGDMQSAFRLLGYPFTLLAKVIHGNAVGASKLGFPTANCQVNQEYIKPKKGVYAGKVLVQEKEYLAMINVGHNPTFNLSEDVSIEAHILDFDQDIYEEEIEVMFFYYIRDEKKFSSINELITQLKQDVSATRSVFNESTI